MSRCIPMRAAAAWRTALMLALAAEAIRRDCVAWTLEVRVSSIGAQELVPDVRVRSRRGPSALLRQRGGCDRDVVPRHPGRRLRGATRRDPRRPMTDTAPATCIVDESTLVLGIETSCDETAAALVMGGNDVVSNVVSTQIDLHADFGGVVPEVASRAHLDALNPVIARAIVEGGVDESRIDAIACTVGPGLVGALLVGVSAAKSLALGVGQAVRRCEPHGGPPVRSLARGPDAGVSAGRAARVRAATRCWSRCRTTAGIACSGRRSTTLPVKRSTRWRDTSTWATPAARRSTRPRCSAIPMRSRSRGR